MAEDRKSEIDEAPDERKDDERNESAASEASGGAGGGKAGKGKAEGKAEKDPEAAEQTAGEDHPVEEAAGKEDAAKKEAVPEEKKPKKERGVLRTKKELAKKDEEIAELRDRVARQMAEFDNFRKRTDREKTVRFDDGAKYILEKLLPVVDNFERGLGQIPEEKKEDPFVTGMEAVLKQLMKVLSDSGVTAIEAKGEPFDPERHNAVMHVDDENEGENVVVEELQKGYLYKDQVLRYSMVKVAN